LKREDVRHGETASVPLVYVVEDDEDLLEEMVAGLSQLGVRARGFESASDLYRTYAVKPSDIVVLDIGLEGEDGLSIAAHLRASGPVGIIMATGRGSVAERVDGLQNGADAYLVKPVDMRELAATVFALDKRLTAHRPASPPRAAGWALIEGGWILTDGMDHRLHLTRSEQCILRCLLSKRGETFDRTALVEAMDEDIHEFNYARINTIISRLRRKAERAGMLLPLHTVRGSGFTFTD